jgi:hypothetical protein
VHQLLKGSGVTANQIIPIYGHSHHIFAAADREHGKPLPSFPASKYGTKYELNFESRSTLLFLVKHGGCWELAASGAQEEPTKERLVKSMVRADDCDTQLNAVEYIVDTLPADCTQSTDCSGFAFHPNSCAEPRPLHKKAESLLQMPEWQPLLGRARSACASRWQKQPACAPPPLDAHCVKNRCVMGPEPRAAAPLTQGLLSPGCAPHDEGSVLLSFRSAQGGAYPYLSLNWWGSAKPQPKKGTYVFDTHGTSSYCPYERGCKMLKDVRATVKMTSDQAGEAEIEGRTYEDELIKVKGPVHFETPVMPVLC